MKKLITLLIIMAGFTSFSGETVYSVRANRADLAIDEVLTLTFDPYWDVHASDDVNYVQSHRAKVKLVYNREMQSDIDWAYQWRYKVQFSFPDKPGVPVQELLISSENGDKGYIYQDYDLQSLTTGETEVKVKIEGVIAEYYDGSGWLAVASPAGDPHLPDDIHLELSVKTERYYELNASENTRMELVVDPQTITARWLFLRGAEEYDLEWVYIDAHSPDYADLRAAVDGGSYDPELPFKTKEPLGVRVNYNQYAVDNVFDKGLVFFRVRPVGRFISGTGGDYSYIKTGAWSYYNTSPSAGEPVGESYLCYHEITAANAFEQGKTWAYSVGFSENGKFGSAVSYYDGSLRARQATAYNNNEDVTLKSESKYDYEGRAAISLPPAPVHGRNLGYQAGFNTVGGVPFNKSHFDTDPAAASLSLDNTSGVSQYFSSGNDFDQENQEAIPNADGFVYSQVKYKKDGTGRVEESGGVGETFAIDGDHTTTYFYGSPTPAELRRLFGSNVSGNANYYRKNMVKDANGQLSVAYVDGGGRTIASALAGAPPNNLVPLDGTVERWTTTLNDGNYLTDEGNTLKSFFVYPNAVEGNLLEFTYDFSGIIFDYTDVSLPPVARCEDCKYELVITITDPNGFETTQTELVEAASFVCADDTYPTDFSGDAIKTFNYTCAEIGDYTITKTLTVRLDDMWADLTAGLESATLLDALTDEALEAVNVADCFTNCDDYCAYLVGYDYDREDVPGRYIGLFAEILANEAHPDHAAAVSMVNTCKAGACNPDELFDGDADEIAAGEIGGLPMPPFAAQCYGYYSQMADQVRPGGYHYIDADGTFWSAVGTAMGDGSLVFYADYNALGEPATGEVALVDVSDLQNPDTFQEEWVELLITKHREYCHYTYCGDLVESNEFDAKLGLYFQDDLGGTWLETTLDILWNGGGDSNPDPFLSTAFNTTAPAGEDLVSRLQNFAHPCPDSGEEGMVFNLFTYVEEISTCLVGAGGTALTEEQKWAITRGLYLGVKQEIIDAYKATESCAYFDDDYTVFKSGSTTPGLDPDGDGISSDDITDFLYESTEFIVPDCEAVCATNVAAWMGSLSESCLASFESAGTLAALEEAFEAYCFEHCNSSNPGGWFYNHAPEIPSDTDGADETYHTVVGMLTTACPDFEISFETTAPETTTFPGTVNQDFPICYLRMIDHANALFALNNDADATNDLDFDDEYGIDSDDDIFGCGLGVPAVSKQWKLEDDISGVVIGGGSAMDVPVRFSEYELDTDENEIDACKFFFGIQTYDAPHYYYDLSKVYAVDNLLKECLTYDVDGNCTDGIISLDVTWHNGTEVVTERARAVITDACYSPGNWDVMEILTGVPGDLTPTYPDWQADCIAQAQETARQNALDAYNERLAEAVSDLINTFECFEGINEQFKMTYDLYEYNYTLFYYDQAGQLVQTVPPAGVYPLTTASFTDGVWDGVTEPPHKQETIYTYNGAGLLTESETPDGGKTVYYYDDLYRLRFVQNAKQLANNQYSYTKYDALGRAIEAGEAGDPAIAMPDLQASVNVADFPTLARRDYTKTYYETGFEEVGLSLPADEFADGQQNLRGAVGAVEKFTANYELAVGGTTLDYEAGTEFKSVTSYSYDYHGNVNELVQTNYHHNLLENEHKHMAYDYDLISGNVQEVTYQKGEQDEWHHRYHYDAANRLVRVFTSSNGEEWEMDAKYFYYLHGSLARVEKGHDKIQGMDFAYNLQGWLKGVNSTTLNPGKDIGQDGHSTGLDKYTGADANGFSLGYYQNDYAPIMGTSAFAGTAYLIAENGDHGSLYNGNISHMVTAMKDENEALLTTQGNNYTYDLLQRIKSMQTYQVTDAADYAGGNAFSATNASNTGKYATTYTFDANGNLTFLTRKDHTGNLMDDFTYNYINPLNDNKLGWVDDAGIPIGGDLTDQDPDNYEYDDIGQLIKDDQAAIENIEWTADGKVRKITFTAASSKPELHYIYDAGGNRLVQITGELGTAGATYEYYVYDATGNLMATYEQYSQLNLAGGPNDAQYTEYTKLKDRNIYGVARVGSKMENRLLYSRNFNAPVNFVVQTNVSVVEHSADYDKEKRYVGDKFYEMANHLNNVLNVVTDRKVGNAAAAGYEADIVSYSDYYPYGMLLPGKHGSSDDGYRYGFQGQEMDDEIKGNGNSVNYKYRMHDPRIGRFFAVDPLTAKYPHYSPYQFDGNMPTRFIELEGLEPGIDGTKAGEQSWATSAYGDENTYYRYTWTEFMTGAFRWETDGTNMTYDEVLDEKLGVWSGQEDSHISNGGSNLIRLDPITDSYGLIQPRSYGEWGQVGSDGRIWIGCLSCHSPIGAYSESIDILGWHKASFAFSLAWGLAGPKIPPLLKSSNTSRFYVHTPGNNLEVLPMTVVEQVGKGAKITNLIERAKELTYVTGNEHALVGLNDGTRALVSGGPGGISFGSNVKTIFGHTHPVVRGGAAANQPSIWDYNSIYILNQSKQRVLIPGGGMQTIFNQGMEIKDLKSLLVEPVTNYNF